MDTSKNRIDIYDDTLRDGARMSGIRFSWNAITDAMRYSLLTLDTPPLSKNNLQPIDIPLHSQSRR